MLSVKSNLSLSRIIDLIPSYLLSYVEFKGFFLYGNDIFYDMRYYFLPKRNFAQKYAVLIRYNEF